MTPSDANKYVETYLSTLRPGTLTFIAGRAETGKTQVGIALARFYSNQSPPKSSIYFTYEMSEGGLRDRMPDVRHVVVCDQLPSLEKMKHVTRQAIADHHVELVIIDYLELMMTKPVKDPFFECARPSFCGQRFSSPNKKLILSFLHEMAVRLRIPIVLFGHLLRNSKIDSYDTIRQHASVPLIIPAEESTWS
jgi:replicative DNA helicase